MKFLFVNSHFVKCYTFDRPQATLSSDEVLDFLIENSKYLKNFADKFYQMSVNDKLFAGSGTTGSTKEKMLKLLVRKFYPNKFNQDLKGYFF